MYCEAKMKYGKEFRHILQDSHFPDEWVSSAIEYDRVSTTYHFVCLEAGEESRNDRLMKESR